MKREQNSTKPGFVARLHKNIFGATSAKPQVELADESLPKEAKVNLVGKKIFELEVSDAKAIRPTLPAGFFYPDARDAADLHAELLRELPPNHPLAGVPLETFAACHSNDDVLFRYRGNPRRFVLVHLTGSGRTEINEHFSAIQWSGTFEEFEDYLLEPPA